MLEMARVLEKGGKILIYVWAKDQGDSAYVKSVALVSMIIISLLMILV